MEISSVGANSFAQCELIRTYNSLIYSMPITKDLAKNDFLKLKSCIGCVEYSEAQSLANDTLKGTSAPPVVGTSYV
jgi:hypothetical protein